MSHHAVPGRQVSVDKLLGVQVRHAVGDLRRHLDHLLQSGRRPPGVILGGWGSHRVISQGGGGTTGNSEQSCERRYLCVRAEGAQEALEVAVGHQLHDDQGGLTFGHHAQQTHLRDEDHSPVNTHRIPAAAFTLAHFRVP